MGAQRLNNYLAVASNEKRYFDSISEYQWVDEYANILVVQCQQIVEKLLKFLVDIYCVGDSEVEKILLSHNIVRIAQMLNDHEIRLSLTPRQLGTLKDFYFECRYPGDDYYVANLYDAECAREQMRTIYNDVLRILKKELERNTGIKEKIPEQVLKDIEHTTIGGVTEVHSF